MVLITINHEMASPDTVLRANDTVSFLPHIGGG
jgi:molybdopterin converting factor small subunit